MKAEKIILLLALAGTAYGVYLFWTQIHPQNVYRSNFNKSQDAKRAAAAGGTSGGDF